MKNKLLIIIVQLFLVFVFASCESAEEISRSFDLEVPTCKVQNDSSVVAAGSTVDLKVQLSDNVGLSKLEFAYDAWTVSESVNLVDQGSPKSYLYQVTIKVPATALTSWFETVYRNDGSSYVTTQVYHKLTLKVYDVNGNMRTAYVYIKVSA
jgi:hypothetical protein